MLWGDKVPELHFQQSLTEHFCARPGSWLALERALYCCVVCALHKKYWAKRQTEAGAQPILCWPSLKPIGIYRQVPIDVPV